jgi:hypothetical protein
MPLHPPPTIELNLALITQPLQRNDNERQALVTFALDNPGSLTALAVVNAFQTAFNGQVSPNFDTDVTVLPPTIKLGDGTAVPGEAVASGASVVGTQANKVLPSNCAMIAKKTTGFGGKKNRGRTYYPWIVDETAVDENGILGGTTVTAFTELFTDLLEDLATATVPMVIANKTLAVPPLPAKPYVTAITRGHTVSAYVCEPLIATQRRRLGR